LINTDLSPTPPLKREGLLASPSHTGGGGMRGRGLLKPDL